MDRVTAPDPHISPMAHAPLTRRALREARQRAEANTAPIETAAREDIATAPIPLIVPDSDGPSHPPIFKPPPPPLPEGGVRPQLFPLTTMAAHTRHARKPRVGFAARVGMAAASVLVVAGGASALALTGAPQPVTSYAGPTLTADITGSTVTTAPMDAATGAASKAPSDAASPKASASITLASLSLCETESFTAALQQGDDAAAIRIAGGGDAFRDAVSGGRAPCVSLSDPSHVWVVVDKLRPLQPSDYVPTPRSRPSDVRSLDGSRLRTDAAHALAALAKAARSDGAGDIALNSGYRSYTTQVDNYSTQKSERGKDGADAVSARPGYSEHQTGLAGDIVPCTADACATLDDLAGTTQGDWIVEHAWEYGWVVRYEKGASDVTGYSPEPWHLRYIGTDLAKAYHQGGYHTLEEFFGLSAAPDYAH